MSDFDLGLILGFVGASIFWLIVLFGQYDKWKERELMDTLKTFNLRARLHTYISHDCNWIPEDEEGVEDVNDRRGESK